MKEIRKYILKSRYTLLITVVSVYMLALVVEGSITGRKAQLLDFENPYFDLSVKNLEEFTERRREFAR